MTRRVLFVSFLVGVVLAVSSVPVGSLVAEVWWSRNPFHEPTFLAVLEEGDRAIHVEMYETLGCRAWDSWRSNVLDDLIEQRRDAPLLRADPRPGFAVVRHDGPELFIMYLQTGWPVKAAEGRWWWTDSADHHDFFYRGSIFGMGFAIPTRPIWHGLLANTIFYAMLTLALLAGLRWRRTRRRRTRGLCVACAYELGNGVGVCPECGLAAHGS